MCTVFKQAQSLHCLCFYEVPRIYPELDSKFPALWKGTMQNVTPMHCSAHNHARIIYTPHCVAVTAPNSQLALMTDLPAHRPSEVCQQVNAGCMTGMLFHCLIQTMMQRYESDVEWWTCNACSTVDPLCTFCLHFLTHFSILCCSHRPLLIWHVTLLPIPLQAFLELHSLAD